MSRAVDQGSADQGIATSLDIQGALDTAQDAKLLFERLPPSHRREYVSWIEEAKKPATRAKRISGMIDRLRTSKG